jgi:carboxypeptidase PM20D1
MLFKRLLLLLIALFLVLAAILAVNTLRKGSLQLQVSPTSLLPIDEKRLAEKLGGAVRLRTVAAYDDADAGAGEFLKLHAYPSSSFRACTRRFSAKWWAPTACCTPGRGRMRVPSR